MYARQQSAKVLGSNRGARLGVYAAIIVMSVIITIFVMAGVEGQAAIPAEPSLYAIWTVAAGAIGGASALYAARGWLGLSGAIGYARALVGSLAAALIGAVIAGVLIMPVYGGIYGPVLLITAVVANPAIAVVWIAVYFCAHYVLLQRSNALDMEYKASETRFASAGLSSLTQAQLYHRK
jgi:hypothetical protein